MKRVVCVRKPNNQEGAPPIIVGKIYTAVDVKFLPSMKIRAGIIRGGYYYKILETGTLAITSCFIDLIEDDIDETELAENRKQLETA